MKVVVAVDSFKGSISSIEAGMAAREGILAARPDADVIVKPLADGGEGTTDALIDGLGGERVFLTVTGPVGKPVKAYYGYIKKSGTAVMEMAAAAGIALSGTTDPLHATTYGLGEMIRHALSKGIRNFIIGIGGSATNDGGIGMLNALGFRFLEKNGRDAGRGAQALEKISSIIPSEKAALLSCCRFNIACDVTNPLFGPQGATYTYGPQKGISRQLIPIIDNGMKNFARLTCEMCGKDFSQVPGSGAAGGLGFAFLSYLNGKLLPGIQLILDAVHLEDELKGADFLVTGEGRLDSQTAMGKAPAGAAKLARKYHVTTIAFAGSIAEDAAVCNQAGIDAFFPIVRGVTSLSDAMEPCNARKNMVSSVEQVFRLL